VNDPHGDITRLLSEVDDPERWHVVLADLYDDLHGLAKHQLRDEKDGTITPTVLVHEAYLRLEAQRAVWQNRAHLFSVAARMMRRVLVDEARARGRDKRGGGVDRERVGLTLLSGDTPLDILELEDAIQELESEDPTLVRIVELRFYAGRTFEEIAESIAMSERHVRRLWAYAKTRLYELLRDS